MYVEDRLFLESGSIGVQRNVADVMMVLDLHQKCRLGGHYKECSAIWWGKGECSAVYSCEEEEALSH